MAKIGRAAATERSASDEPGEIVIPRVEERATVEKRDVERGRVRIAKTVTEVEQPVEVALAEDRIDVERVPIGRFVEAAEPPHVEGDTTVVPVYEERAVVERRLYLVEEVRVTKRREERRETCPVTVRREEVRVEREGGGSRR